MAKTEFAISLKLLSEQFKGGLNKVQKQIQNFKNLVVSAFAGIGAFEIGKQMVRAGAEFQNAMARVQAVSKASTQDLKEMREEAMRLGRDTKYTATEAANALEMLVRNGLKPLQARDALQGTLELAQSQAIQLAEAADIAVTAMNGFGLSTKDLGRINDVLASTASNTATNVLELFEAFKVAAPVAHAAGISLEETATALGMLANRGFRGSDAGTGLKQIVLALASQTPEATKVLQKYGVQVNETELRTKGLIAVLKELSATGLGNSISDMADFFNKLGAPKGAAILGDMDGMEALYQAIANSQGEAARMFEEGLGEWEKAYKTLISVWENTQIKIFDGGRKIFTEPLNWIADIIRKIQDIPTVATAAFGLLSAKLGTIFTKTNKELVDITEKQYKDRLAKAQAAYSNATLAHAVKNATTGLATPNTNSTQYFKSLQMALQGVSTQFDMGTKYGKILQGALNNLDTIVNTSNKNTKKYKKALAELTLQMQQLSSKAKNTNVQVLHQQLNNVSKESVTASKTIQGVFTKLGTGIATVGKSIFAFMGGWVGIVLTLVTVISTKLVSAWRSATAAARESNKIMTEAADRNQKLDTTFLQLVNTLRKYEQSSAAWQSAMSILKREYPELIERLHLEQINVNLSAKEYENYTNKIKEAIKWQKQYNNHQAATDASNTLLNDYFGDFKYRKAISKYSEMTNPNKDELVRKIELDNLEVLLQNILTDSTLSDKDREDKIAKAIQDVIADENGNVKKGFENTASITAKTIINDFDKKVGKRLEALKKFVAPDEKITTQNIDKLLKDTYSSYELEREKIYQKADAQKWDESKINQELATIAQKFIDELTDSLQGTTYEDLRGDKHNALDYAKNTDVFTKLLQQSKLNIRKDTSDTGADNINDAEKRYATTLKFLNKQKELNHLNEKDYNEKLLSALQTLISAYEYNADATAIDTKKYRDLIKTRDNLIKTLKEQEDAAERAKENQELDNRSRRKADKLDKNYSNIIEGRGKEKINKWNYLDFDSAFDGQNKQDEIRLDYLKEQLDRLKQLRADVSDEEIEKAKELSSLGTNALIEQVNKLDLSIEKLGEHVGDLEDKFQLNKAREEIRLMKKEVNDMQYEAVKETFNAFTSLADTIQSFEGFDKMNGFEQFTLLTESIFSTIDTIKGLIDTWQSLNELLELFGLKRQALQAIETGSSAANIAAVQGEAAAVVAAEAEKTAAITAAQAEQTAVNMAAKALQIKAAQTAMAAEATAAFAAIPFVGPALAAAQIAEMQALIAAAAALPAFANGGIVGGSKYVGDQNIARVNSGEMILNGTQQKNLWNAISGNKLGGSDIGNVEFKIKGTELVGVLNNYSKKISKVK